MRACVAFSLHQRRFTPPAPATTTAETAGFEGLACERTSCPSACNYRGVCISEYELADAASREYRCVLCVCVRTTSPPHCRASSRASHVRAPCFPLPDSTPWDANKVFGCVCDLGYRGVDCSLIECPSKADPRGGWGNESGRDCSGRGVCDYSKVRTYIT